jgi:PAS domain S-box-containing protein
LLLWVGLSLSSYKPPGSGAIISHSGALAAMVSWMPRGRRRSEVLIVVVDSDTSRRTAVVRRLSELGHEVRGRATLGDDEPPEAEIAVIAGVELIAACSAYRRAQRARWVLAIAARELVGPALAAGAHDCLSGIEAVDLDELELRIEVARAGCDLEVQRRETEEAQRQSEASLRSVLYATPDGIIVHSEGRYLFVNPAAVAQLGLDPHTNLVGRPIFEQLKPNDVLPVSERIDEMMRTGQPAPIRDIHFLRADGELLVGEVASIPAMFDGSPAIISIIRDVGEQRRFQSQLFLTDRLATVGTLVVGVAHEINNPLSWVMGNLGLLADEFDNQVRMREVPGHDREAVAASRSRVRDLLARAQEGTERVRRIVRDLGRFGRPDDDGGQIIDLHALLDSTLEIADVQIRHRARLVRDYRASGYVRGSEARLGQVFLNLLVNAGQAIGPGSPRQNHVSVSTRDLDDGRIEVVVSDTGCGMSERIRQRIFEPFYTTKSSEGTGIGLAISHSIVTAMGGEILVDSELDRGTSFRVRLPSAVEDVPSRPAGVIREESDTHRAAAPAARILVVDDEPLICEMVCDALATHDVVAVANGRDALERIIHEDWDLILCDMILPELSGLDVYKQLQVDRPDALDKLVFMTGGALSGKGPRLPDGARARRLEKPFSIKSLRALARAAARS